MKKTILIALCLFSGFIANAQHVIRIAPENGDMVWMEKFIGEHLENQLPIIEFKKIKDQIDLNEE